MEISSLSAIIFFCQEGKNRRHFDACDLRKGSSERTGRGMMALEELKAVDVRTVNREKLWISGMWRSILSSRRRRG